MANDVSSGDKHIVCQYKDNISTFGIWIKHNTLNYALPLILLQLSAISIASMLIEMCLRPLGQSSIVSQILVRRRFPPCMPLYVLSFKKINLLTLSLLQQ